MKFINSSANGFIHKMLIQLVYLIEKQNRLRNTYMMFCKHWANLILFNLILIPVKQRTDEWHRLKMSHLFQAVLCTKQQAWLTCKVDCRCMTRSIFQKKKKAQVKIFANPCSMAQIMK